MWNLLLGRTAPRALAAALALGLVGLGFLVASRHAPRLAAVTQAAPADPGAETAARKQAAAADLPVHRFNADGELLLPADFRRWVFAGSSLGLGYREPGVGSGGSRFHTVLIQPAAYDHYMSTGEFPDGTMLALNIYERAEKVPPAERGYFEGERIALSIALKDTGRFEERWGYFSFSGPNGTVRDKASRIPPAAGCNGCHAEHGAVDNVFVQFYPNLRERTGPPRPR